MLKHITAALCLLSLMALHTARADDDGHSDSHSSSSDSSRSSDSSSGDASSGGSGGGSGGNPHASEHDFLRLHHPVHLEPAVAGAPVVARAIAPQEEQLFIARGWNAQTLRAEAAVQQAAPSNTNINTKAALALSQPTAATPTRNTPSNASPSDALLSLNYTRLYNDTADDVAVIIGNVDYNHSGIPNNDPAARDAAAFDAFARQALGVSDKNIIHLNNATQASLLRIFGDQRNANGQLSDWVRPSKSRVYVYYSGHGAPATANDSFLIPVDADSTRLSLNGYALSTLYRNLSQIRAKQVWLVMESCFSGVAQNGPIVTNASPVFARSTMIAPPNNVSVFSAAMVDQIASWEPDKSHGLFTKHFLQGMSGKADAAPFGNGDGVVNGVELNAYLKDNLSYWARRYHGRDQVALIQNWIQP